MFILSDEKNDIANKILKNVCGLSGTQVVRYPNGYCHSVYYVKNEIAAYILRVTNEGSKEYYQGALKWLPELDKIGIPVPAILEHGQYENVYYTLLSFIAGTDLGDVYGALRDAQKKDIAKDIANVQKKISALPTNLAYGYTADSQLYETWIDFLDSQIKRASERIAQNKIWGIDIIHSLRAKMDFLRAYLKGIQPIAFLGDITTKNVLIHDGRFSGIIDVDEICYGDPFFVIGLTNMALLAMENDTDYIAYWLDEMNATETERKALTFYTLLFCVDFMSEQGMRFENGKSIPINQEKINTLNAIFAKLCDSL